MPVKLMGPNDFLDPDIKDLVEFIDLHCFVTVDSGDGHSKFEGKGAYDDPDALRTPHVIIRSTRETMLDEADRLLRLLLGHGAPGAKFWQIEASYDPADGSCLILLTGLSSSDVPGISTTKED